jgi:hypothetical protein
MLAKLLPLLVDMPNVVLMHDLSDLRYDMAVPGCQDAGIWKGTNTGAPSFCSGHVFSNVAQAISVLDFTSRNRLALHSAAESLQAEIGHDHAKVSRLKDLLGDDFFSLQAWWFWFTLNEAPSSLPLSFPRYTGPASFTIEGARKHILALQEQVAKLDKGKRELQILFEETGRKQEREIAQLQRQIAQVLVEKQNLENRWNAVHNSISWRLLNKWRRVRNRVAPDRTWLRTLYELVLRPLRVIPPNADARI